MARGVWGWGSAKGLRAPNAPAPQNALLLLALEAGDKHLLGPLGCLQVVLQHTAEELHQLLVTLSFGILDVGLKRLYVIRGLVEHGDEVVVLILRLPRCFGHDLCLPALLVSLRPFLIPCSDDLINH